MALKIASLLFSITFPFPSQTLMTHKPNRHFITATLYMPPGRFPAKQGIRRNIIFIGKAPFRSPHS